MMMRGQPQNMTLPMNNEINDHLSHFYKVRFWLYVLGEQAEFTQRSKSFTELPLSALATSALLPNTLEKGEHRIVEKSVAVPDVYVSWQHNAPHIPPACDVERRNNEGGNWSFRNRRIGVV